MNIPLHALKALFKSNTARNKPQTVAQLVRGNKLEAAFQPIVNLKTASISGHEAYVRSSKGVALQHPKALMTAAKETHFQRDFELACVDYAVSGWGKQFRQGQLFINLTAKSLVALEAQLEEGRLLQTLEGHVVPLRRIVFEVTEHSKFERVSELVQAANKLRAKGATIAMDDLKGSEGSLKMWFKLSPDIVKMDARLTNGVANDAEKCNVIRSLVALAAKFGSTLVAKGVETAEDLRTLRDLGVDFAQGFFLGSPDHAPAEVLNQRARGVISEGWEPEDSQPWAVSA